MRTWTVRCTCVCRLRWMRLCGMWSRYFNSYPFFCQHFRLFTVSLLFFIFSDNISCSAFTISFFFNHKFPNVIKVLQFIPILLSTFSSFYIFFIVFDLIFLIFSDNINWSALTLSFFFSIFVQLVFAGCDQGT